jgi:hypothetical protein
MNSFWRRALFSTFLALIACGMSFYVILFLTLAVRAITHQANPATTPALQADLKHVVLPFSVVVGTAVFLASFKKWGKKDKALRVQSKGASNKPAA